MVDKKRLKMAVIAGASHAIKFKNQHPDSSEEQAIQDITKNVDNILKNIDEDD